MKNKSILFFAIMLAFIFATPQKSQAQSEDYPINVGVNTSASLASFLIRAVGNGLESVDDEQVKFSRTPGLQATFDYGVTNFFSIGIAGYYQSFSTTITDYNDGTNIIAEAKSTLTRYNVAIRPLFHYANNGQLDMYSGLRLGYTGWGVSSQDLNQEDIDALGSVGGFRVQVIAYGIRGYFNDWLGAGMELAIGSPHYLMAGINIRL